MTITKEDYEFERTVTQLEEYKGNNTELISLYVPPTKRVSAIRDYLSNERAEAKNIKSKQTRKNVISALKSIESQLRYYENLPENGLVIFSGVVGDGEMKTITLDSLPQEVITFKYHCDKEFHVEPLLKMKNAGDEKYGLIVLDRRTAQIGTLSGSRINQEAELSSLVPGKHTAGGQSQARFERLRQEAIQNFYQKVGKTATDVFFDERHNLKGILIGGPSPTKEEFIKKESLHHELQNKIIGEIDMSDTTEKGLTTLVESSKDVISNTKIVKQREQINDFLEKLREANQTVYGWKETVRLLELGAVDKVLVSNVNQPISLFECENEHSTVVEENIERCLVCQTEKGEKVEVDGSQYINSLVSKSGASIEYIDTSFDEGDQLLSVFGGVAGLLRYDPRE